MREILFRGKSKDGFNYWTGEVRSEARGKWIYHSVVYHDDKAGVWRMIALDGLMREVDTDSIGQYTGIEDENGKKVFEGDIVRGLFQFGLPFSAVCTFKNGAFGVEWEHGDGMHFQPFAGFYGVEWEVVGNIWDNPELRDDFMKLWGDKE